MKNLVKIKNVVLGEGKPKICVPLTGEDDSLLKEEIENLSGLKYDVVEWRMDFHKSVHNIDSMLQTLTQIKEQLKDRPLLATFRTYNEGGKQRMTLEEYINLNRKIIETRLVDIVDIELFLGDDLVREMIRYAHGYGVKVIVSNHDFEKTPAKEELLSRLKKMQTLGADLPKIAVMPQNAKDVLILLEATSEMSTYYAQTPIITMSMGKLGLVSRLSGEIFGSAMTFGAAQSASAPGQIEVSKLGEILEIINE